MRIHWFIFYETAVPIMVQKFSPLKTPLETSLTKGVFKEVF